MWKLTVNGVEVAKWHSDLTLKELPDIVRRYALHDGEDYDRARTLGSMTWECSGTIALREILDEK